MSAAGAGLGQVVLSLVTDARPLRQGLTEARALTIRETAQLKNSARVQLTADLLRLRQDFQTAQREATTAKRLIEQQSRYRLAADLSQLRSDLRMAEREHAASLRRMQQQSQGGGGGAGGALAGLGGAVLGGLGIGAGLGLVTQGIGAVTGVLREGVGVVTQYNASVQSAEALIKGFTRSTFAVAEAQRLANQAVEQGRGGYAETLTALASLTPLSRKYGESLEEVLRTAQLLAAIDPIQGFEGAKIALQEALSGDFTSLQRRFELPRGEIQKLKDEGVSNLQIVNRTLASLGITQAVLTEQAGTFNQQLRIGADLARRFVADAGKPVFDFGTDVLREGIALLKSPEVQGAGREFAADLRAGIADLKSFFADPDNRQAIVGTAQDLRDLAASAGTLTDLAGPLLGLATTLAQINNALDALGLGLVDFLSRTGPFPLIRAFEDLKALLDDPGVKRFIDGTGATTGRSETQRRADDGFDIRAGRLGADQGLTPDQQTSFLRFAQTQRDNGRDVSDLGAVYNRWIDDMERAGLATADLTRLTDEQTAAIARNNAVIAAGPTVTRAPAGAGLLEFGPADRRPGPTGGTVAVAPESETQFDIAANVNQGERYAAMLAQGRADLRAYVTGFASEDFDLFGKLQPQLQASFEQAFGGLDIGQQFERGLGDLDTLTARIVDDIRQYGAVTTETSQQVIATLGEQGRSVIALANEYAALAGAQDRVKQAADELEAAQDGLTAAQRQASRNAESSRENIDELQRGLSALSQQAADVAQGYADRLDALREEREAADELAEAHRRAFQEQIDGLAEVRRAREANEAVENLTAEQNRTLLSFEQRIRAARRPGGQGEAAARALEEERDRFLARSRYALDLAQLEARVADDAAERAKKPIEEAQAAQEEKDRAAAAAIDERIAALEDEAEVAARDYAARERAVRDLIAEETERARIVAAADRKAIEDAQGRVDRARDTKELADDELIAQQGKVTALDRQKTLLEGQLGAWRDFIAYLQSQGIDVARFFNGTGATGVPMPSGTPQEPAGGGGGGGALEASYRTPSLPQSAYVPPRAPAPYVGGQAASAGLGANALRASGRTVNLNGPLSVLNVDTVRETVEVEQAAELGADRALARLYAAIDDDERTGGGVTWREGA
jgi:hypothetical protein